MLIKILCVFLDDKMNSKIDYFENLDHIYRNSLKHLELNTIVEEKLIDLVDD